MATKYVTKLGDMWDVIAKSEMGDERFMSILMKANPDYADYNMFPAGIELSIPSATKAVIVNLPPWRR
jgi:phage tail protein X